MDAVLGKMGRNFLIAAFVPALAFASLSLFVFGPILPKAVVDQLTISLAPLDQPVLLLLMTTVVIGFSLHSLNTTMYKLIEGYLLLEKFPAISNFQKRKVKREYAKIVFLEKLYKHLRERDEDPHVIEKVRNQLYYLSANYQRNYPSNLNFVMPTRFGNAFRALETYPRQRYNMDAVLLWPRLLHVIPDPYHSKLDESNNRLAFLVNCSVLSLGMALLSGFAAIYQLLMLRCAQTGKEYLLYFIPVVQEDAIKYRQNAFLYLLGAAIMMALFAVFYRAAIPLVVQYGDLVKSTFDLFRFSLIDALRLKRPHNYDEETALWDNLSMFIGHGLLAENVYLVPFDYEATAQSALERNEESQEDSDGEE
ncbi:MAG: hypothetical protein KDE09_17180 [Anaerolineales bacterium]|nr:hypothetical protein [Anaerolineales bacterium]